MNDINDNTNLYNYLQEIITDINNVDTLQTEEVDSAFEEQFLRHMYKDNDLVPEIKTGSLEINGQIVDAPLSSKHITIIDNKQVGFKIPVLAFPYHWNRSGNDTPVPKPIIKITSSTTDNMDLYKFVGYHNGNFYYSAISKLGASESGKYIYEYKRGENIQSSINDNPVGLSNEIVNKLRAVKYESLINDFGKMTETKKVITFANLKNVRFIPTEDKSTGVKLIVFKAEVKDSEGNITIKDIGANPSNTYAGAVNNGLEAIFASGIDVIKKGSENQC